ncbi:flippase [Desulfoscipio geothermicus]|uniref:Membrane protein involved in the export of O-antigen and teichoic acid n=1 Tax=Desulfoscipio geothermicus DSM 3669 TaxID=1121426 RepID=A0A1I6E8Y7_9FIRM|nr:flippase [Desulfoscipio geothermicus]SFR14189.1 Membrane protein involved in the export of O-antigen and teichoic acid [Desulfoscipio geothermicus DSM 3669]
MRILALIFNRISAFFGLDWHMKEVLSGAFVAFTFKVLGAGLGFAFNVLLARLLGAERAGLYYLAFTVITIATVVGRMGLDNALLRFTATNAVQEKWEKVSGVYRKGIFIAVIASLVATIIVGSSASWVAKGIFSEPALVKPIRLMALAILPISLLTLHAELLKGLKRIRDAMLVQGVGVPLISISLLAFLGGPFQVTGAVTAYVCATTIVLLLSVALWRRATPKLRGVRGTFDTRLLLATSMPLLLVASMNLIMSWTDTIMLGFWIDSKSVGIYNIAMRAAMLTSFILFAVNSIVAPKFAALYAKGELEALGIVARNSTALMTVLALPILLLFILSPKFILGIFGPGFISGSNVLIILALGQFVNVATGSVGYLLMMTGYEKLMRNNIIGSAILNIILNTLLVPKYGITGAAIATAVSLAIMNLVSAGLVYWKLSIITLPIPKGAYIRAK